MIGQSLKLGFLASGNGTSARAIVGAIQAGELAAEARLMVSNNRKAPALDWAREAGVPTLCMPTQADPDGADQSLAAELVSHGVELIVLSGYLRRLGPATLAKYSGRILNIHPGPLPEFGGHGMYGRRVHEAVLAANARESGVAIHLVDEEYDRGPIVAQRAVAIEPGDTPELLEARVNAVEPRFFVEVLRLISEGKLAI